MLQVFMLGKQINTPNEGACCHCLRVKFGILQFTGRENPLLLQAPSVFNSDF